MTADTPASYSRRLSSAPPPLVPQLLYMTDGTRVGMAVRDMRDPQNGHRWWQSTVQPSAPAEERGGQINRYLRGLPNQLPLRGLRAPRAVLAVCSGPEEPALLRELRAIFVDRARVYGVSMEHVLLKALVTPKSEPLPPAEGIHPIPGTRTFDLELARGKGVMVIHLDPLQSSVRVGLPGLAGLLEPRLLGLPATPYAQRLVGAGRDPFTTWEALISRTQDRPGLLAEVLAAAVRTLQSMYRPMVRTVVLAGPLACRLLGEEGHPLSELREPSIQVGVLDGLPPVLFRGSLMIRPDDLEG